MSDQTMRTGALYIRVSTHGQEELSPDAQKRLLLEYAAKNNIIISKDYIYEEDGISGRKADKRPQFQQMIAHAKSKEHPFDVILVWKFSRFARNQEESIVYKSMLRRDKVEVISISEPLIDGPFGSLIERIIEWMDEYYSIRLSGEVFRGMTENALRGKYQARPPLGYRIPHAKETPVIVPEEARIVQQIFDLYTEYGYGIYDITRRMNELGYQTSHKKPFERRSIEYILKNPSYTGKSVWNRHNNTDKSLKDKSEWIITDGFHDAIITEEQFEKAQERFRSEYRPTKQQPSGVCRHWLSGIVKCSTCGRTLSTSVQRDKRYGRTYTNFQCYGYLKGKCPVSHRISEKKLVPLVLDTIKQVLSGDDVPFTVMESAPLPEASERTRLEERLREVDKKESRIKQAYRDGIDTIEEYKENKILLQRERDEIRQKLDAIQAAPVITDPDEEKQRMLAKIRDVYSGILDENLSMQTKNELAKSVIRKIIFDRENNTIDIEFYSLNPL